MILKSPQNKPTALITGVTGQDGAYLTKLLIKHGYDVVGLVKNAQQLNKDGLVRLGVFEKVHILECDLLDLDQLTRIIKQYRPTEVYNLAAQSSVSVSDHSAEL